MEVDEHATEFGKDCDLEISKDDREIMGWGGSGREEEEEEDQD